MVEMTAMEVATWEAEGRVAEEWEAAVPAQTPVLRGPARQGSQSVEEDEMPRAP